MARRKNPSDFLADFDATTVVCPFSTKRGYLRMFPDVPISIGLTHESGDTYVSLEMFEAHPGVRGTGAGTEAMRRILDLADKHGLSVYLDPHPLDDGWSWERLVKWYASFGFDFEEENAEDRKQSGNYWMQRLPHAKGTRRPNPRRRNPAVFDTLTPGTPNAVREQLQRLSRDDLARLQDELNSLDDASTARFAGMTRLWHGAPASIAEKIRERGFARTKGRRSGFMGSPFEVDNLALFLTENKALAEAFGVNRSERGESTEVLEVYADLRQPLDMTTWARVPKPLRVLGEALLGQKRPRQEALFWLVDQPAFMDAVRDLGYDAVRFTESAETVKSLGLARKGEVTVAVLDPTRLHVAPPPRGSLGALLWHLDRGHTKTNPHRRNPAQTDTPASSAAFRRWFSASKVVDAKKKPLVVYHGTTAGGFDAFRPNYRKGEQLGFGIHFAADREFAAKYAEDPTVARKGKAPKVYEVYLSIQNPLNADAFVAEGSPEFALAKKLAGARLLAFRNAEGIRETFVQRAIDQTTALRAEKLIREAGYDGIVYESVLSSSVWTGTGMGRKRTGSSRSYIVFEPTQVKSATANAGTFDPADASIYRNPRHNGRGGTSAERTDPDLWEAVKREVTAGDKGGKPGQWSARKAQLSVALYKQRGGGYWGEKSPTNSLAKWTREKWRTKSGRPSLETGERYLPSKAIAALTDAEYRATTRAKRAGMRKGQQFVAQPEDVALKVRAYRKNPVQDFRDENAVLFGTYGAAETIFTKLAKTQFKERTRGVFEPPQGSPKEDLRGMTRRVLRGLGIRPRARAYSIDWLSSKNRNKGTGSRVVREIEQTLRNEGEEVVFLVSGWVEHGAPHSRGFWERMGYREVPGNYGHLFVEKNEEEWWRDDYEGSEDDRIMYKVLGRTNPTPRVCAYRENPPHRPLPKRRVLELLADPVSRRALRRFYRALAYYQLPQDYSKEGFREAYDALPDEVKDALTYRGRKRLWRGADSQQIGDPAISWSTSKSWAKWFGYCLFPFSDLAGYDATIDTSRAAALVRNTEIEDDYGACDEENEVIVLGARWKKKMGHDELVSRRRKDRM